MKAKMPLNRIFSLTILMFFLSGCLPEWGNQTTSIQITTEITPSRSPFQPLDQPPLPTVTRAYALTTTPVSQTLWISPAVPFQLSDVARDSSLIVIDNPEAADVRLDVVSDPLTTASAWIYALVTPFPSTVDEVAFADVQAAWEGWAQGPFAGIPLRMDSTTLAAFSGTWGAPDPTYVLVEEKDYLLDSSWAARPSWAIVPFEELDPRWKVLTIDGLSPVRNNYDASFYPLKVFFSSTPDILNLPITNRDPGKLTILIMTGVTALVRSTASRMVTKGLTYPGEDVRETFRAADLLHISNEVPFYEDCPYPLPLQATLIFCSDPSYIALLEDIGTDIVELTGNHVQDYGSEAFLFTLGMYEDRDWIYYGGGRNQAEAQQAALVEHNGNKIAFVGCNQVGPEFSWAEGDHPGGAQCDFKTMQAEITRLRSEGYLPVVTFQHYEYYSLYPTTSQIDDFRSMAEAGAVIVSGSQSHFPQYMEFFDNAYIHYGLGNLFFDQMDYPAVGTRREFADRHVFYNGRLLSTELLTYMLEDYARPREMLDWERQQFLLDVFEAGGFSR